MEIKSGVKTIWVFFVISQLLAGCASASPVTVPSESDVSEAKASIAAESKLPAKTEDPGVSRTIVLWPDYAVGTQALIDQYTNLKDCRGLQSYVGMATATEGDIKAKTGHGNDALLKYIDESMAIAGCS